MPKELQFSVAEFNRLLAGFQSGCESLANEFAATYSPTIRSMIRLSSAYQVVRTVTIDDLVQETLIHLLRAPNCECHVKAYLRTIAVGRVKKQVERELAKRRTPRRANGETCRPVGLDQVQQAFTNDEDPAEVFARKDRDCRIVASLSETDHEIYQLVSAGYRQAEIAARVFLCDRTIRRRLKKIRRCVELSMAN